MTFDEKIIEFITLCHREEVRMILVGGGAVNFHGYQRHSADVDFWIELAPENLKKLHVVLRTMGYEFQRYPEQVLKGLQNISIKISPVVDIEIITRFDPGRDFSHAYKHSVNATLRDHDEVQYQVLSYEDLVNSKLKSGRPKDLLDIQELERIRKNL